MYSKEEYNKLKKVGKKIMIKFSKNKKLNGVLNAIYEELAELGAEEVNRYKADFKGEPDYNIAQYGNLLCYFYQVYDFYKNHGYKTTDNFSTDKVWNIYLRQVGYVARTQF